MEINSLLSFKALQILKQNPGMQSKIASRVAQIQAEAMVEANAQYNSELASTEKANKSSQEANSKSKLGEEIHNNRKIASNQEPRKDVVWNRNNSFSYPDSNGSVTSNTNFSKEYVAPKYPLALSDAKNPYNAVINEAKANAKEYSELVQAESKALAIDRSNIALKNKQNSLLLEESIQTENLINSQSTGGIDWTPKSNKLSGPDGRHLPALTTDNNVFEELNKNAKFRADENVKRAATRISDKEYAKGISRGFPATVYTAADDKLPSTFNTSYSLPKIPAGKQPSLKQIEVLPDGTKINHGIPTPVNTKNTPKTVKKIYAGADSNIPVELVGDEILDADRNWRGYKTTTGSFVESERLFNTNKEADEHISKLNKSSTQPKTSKSVSTQTPPVNKAYSTYNYIGDANSLSKVPLTNKGTPNKTNVKVSGKTSVSSNLDRPVKPINRGGSLRESLKGMGIYVLDTETTGLQKSDKMFSAAYSKTNGKITNTPSSVTNNTFDINVNANRTAFIDVNGNYDTDRHIAAVENNLRKAHSSKKFGKEQHKRGSLRSIAEDIVHGRLTTHEEFLTSLAEQFNADKEGSIVFAHNTNFENSVFNNIRGDQRNAGFTSIFDALQERNISNSKGLFSIYHTLSNPTKVVDNHGSVQKANAFYNEYMIDAIKSKDHTRVKDTLNSYASKQMDVVDDLIEQIKITKLKQGAYSTVDTMHLQRALMSFGALSGDVDVANLRLGNSIDVMSKAWGFGPEQHTALDDIDKQRKITDILVEEIDNYRKDGTYKSEKLSVLNKYINENNIGTETYKKTILNEFMNKVKSKDDHQALTKLNDFIENQNSLYEVASGDHQERLNFASAFNAEKDKLLADKQLSFKTVKDRLEEFGSSPNSINSESAKNSNKALKGFDMLEHVKANKGIYGATAAIVAGTLLLGGGAEGKGEKYNTYDELYNGMYYGSPFADWQERNNSHKVLY